MPSTTASPDQEQLELVHLTDQELIDFTRLQNAQAWKGALSIKDYVLREQVLGKSKMVTTPPNKLLIFMLRNKTDKAPLCSIELLIRKSKKYTLNKHENVVEQEDILSGCIGGVYTYPQHRGNGYARIMVDKLVVEAKELVGPLGFVFLYSEIGEYYSKNGFLSQGVDLINIPLTEGQDFATNTFDIKYDLINYHHFDLLMESYNQQNEQEINAKVLKDGKSRITVVPSSKIIDWFHLRSKYISYKIFYEPKQNQEHIDFYNESYESIKSKLELVEPKQFGIKLYNTANEVAGFIVWTMDFNNQSVPENYVTVLKIVSFDENSKDEVAIKLLSLLKTHLIKNPILNGMNTTKIVIWESEISSHIKNVLVNQWNAQSNIDNPSRSAILMNSPIEDAKLRESEIIWEGNDKLPWF